MTAPDPSRAAVLLDRIEADLAELRAMFQPSAELAFAQRLSTAEAAERFGLTDRQIRRLCMKGAGQRIGAGWVVDPVRLRAMLGR